MSINLKKALFSDSAALRNSKAMKRINWNHSHGSISDIKEEK